MASPRQVIIITDEALAHVFGQLDVLLGDEALGYRGTALRAVMTFFGQAVRGHTETSGDAVQEMVSELMKLTTRLEVAPPTEAHPDGYVRMKEPHKLEWEFIKNRALQLLLEVTPSTGE